MLQIMLKIMFQVIVLVLVMLSCLPSFTAAETKNEGKEKKDELTKKISQQDDARGETDLAKLWQTVAQLEMKVMNSDEKLEMQMRKTNNKIRKLEMQMENKDKIIRQLDQKLGGPVEPLAKFLIEVGTEIKDNTKKIVKLEKEGAEIKNNTKKIAECEKGFCGTCQRPYGAKMIPLRPYLGSHYAIYTEILVWATARAACANHGGQLASMETNDEWQHVFEELNKYQNQNGSRWFWFGAQKVGGGGYYEGWQWLTGGDISKDNSAWNSYHYNGKCLLAGGLGVKVDDNWYDYDCSTQDESYYALCEFK